MSKSIRTFHRWISLVFTLAVIVNIAALMLGNQAFWIGLLALVPLILLLVTGLYMFVLPIRSAARPEPWRRRPPKLRRKRL